jgi:hypothetical protein
VISIKCCQKLSRLLPCFLMFIIKAIMFSMRLMANCPRSARAKARARQLWSGILRLRRSVLGVAAMATRCTLPTQRIEGSSDPGGDGSADRRTRLLLNFCRQVKRSITNSPRTSVFLSPPVPTIMPPDIRRRHNMFLYLTPCHCPGRPELNPTKAEMLRPLKSRQRVAH